MERGREAGSQGRADEGAAEGLLKEGEEGDVEIRDYDKEGKYLV